MNLEKIKKEIKELSSLQEKTNKALFKLQEEVYRADLSLFTECRMLLKTEKWPIAIDFAKTEEEKQERAKSIIDHYIQEDLTNKKFLDYGCGEGHVVEQALKKASYAIGYDVKNPNKENTTDDFIEVMKTGPYDIILVYDVIDHAKNENYHDILKQIHTLSNSKTKIFFRFHPWISRSGGHYFEQINKAYLQLFFYKEELDQMGINNPENETTIKNTIGLNFYTTALHQFKILDTNIQNDKPFFENNKIGSRIIYPAKDYSPEFIDIIACL